MPYQEVPDADKQQLYDAYNQGEDNLEVARVVGIKQNTAYHIFCRIEGKDRVISLPCDVLDEGLWMMWWETPQLI